MFDGAGHDLPISSAKEIIGAMLEFFKS